MDSETFRKGMEASEVFCAFAHCAYGDDPDGSHITLIGLVHAAARIEVTTRRPDSEVSRAEFHALLHGVLQHALEREEKRLTDPST